MESIRLVRTEAEPAEEDEVALVEAARRDPAAFSALYRRYVTPVYRYLFKWVGDPAEAEDLTAQVFMEALQGLLHYRERGLFAAWLFTIARRKAIAAYRHQRHSLQLEEAEQISENSPDPLEQVIQADELERMQTLLASLDPEKRDLLYLRFTAGLSFAEIGALLGRSEAVAKMSVYRVLQKLHEKWEEQ